MVRHEFRIAIDNDGGVMRELLRIEEEAMKRFQTIEDDFIKVASDENTPSAELLQLQLELDEAEAESKLIGKCVNQAGRNRLAAATELNKSSAHAMLFLGDGGKSGDLANHTTSNPATVAISTTAEANDVATNGNEDGMTVVVNTSSMSDEAANVGIKDEHAK